MKSRAALALSIAGILVTGSAAPAVNTHALNTSHTGTTGNADRALLPDDSATSTPTPTDVAADLKPSAEATSTSTHDDSASPSPVASPTPIKPA